MFTEKRPDCLYGLNIIQSGQSAPWAELVYFKKMSFLIQKSRGTIAQVRARAENRAEILRVIRIFCARAARAYLRVIAQHFIRSLQKIWIQTFSYLQHCSWSIQAFASCENWSQASLLACDASIACKNALPFACCSWRASLLLAVQRATIFG